LPLQIRLIWLADEWSSVSARKNEYRCRMYLRTLQIFWDLLSLTLLMCFLSCPNDIRISNWYVLPFVPSFLNCSLRFHDCLLGHFSTGRSESVSAAVLLIFYSLSVLISSFLSTYLTQFFLLSYASCCFNDLPTLIFVLSRSTSSESRSKPCMHAVFVPAAHLHKHNMLGPTADPTEVVEG
jgi:hypothetical protein